MYNWSISLFQPIVLDNLFVVFVYINISTVLQDRFKDDPSQGCNARKVNFSCVHIETSSLSMEFVNKNKCISVRLVSEEVKSITF